MHSQRLFPSAWTAWPALAFITCIGSLAPAAHAQLIDDVEIRRAGADAVLRLRFTAPIRFQRSISAGDGNLTEAYYELLGDVSNAQSPGERRFVGGDNLPVLTITDEDVGTTTNSRKLVIRAVPPTQMQVRAGRANNSIDLVLVGLGNRIKPDGSPAPAPAAPSAPAAPRAQTKPAEGRFQVVLSRSSGPDLQLNTPIPAALQDYSVSTTKRTGSDGKPIYELTLGLFATAEEAGKAAEMLRSRFPQAKVAAATAASTAAAPTPAPAVTVSAPAVPAAPAPAPVLSTAPEGPALLAQAREADARGDTAAAIDTLNRLLDLPPNQASREAQELIGQLRLKTGDTARAQREFELFLKLYPEGDDSKRVAAQLAQLNAVAPPATTPAPAPAPKTAESTTTVNGSSGLYFYGGNSMVRSADFKDSPLSGLPELVQNPDLSSTDQKLLQGNVDLNYRNRTTEHETRLVFRDTYEANLMAGKPDHNKLSALYLDHKSFVNGTSVRVGRQSPQSGGVMGRFDGVQAGYAFAPKWKVNAVIGKPTEKLYETNRYFYGTSVDADALTEHVGASVYAIEQRIDGQTDRRALGADLRYFNGGAFAMANLDYDVMLHAFNIASVQGTWQQTDANGNAGTGINFIVDRRAQPLLMLGNALFFQDPNGGPIPMRLSDALALRSLDTLRDYVKTITAYSNQAQIGMTQPLTPHWQIGGNVQLSSIDAIPPVPDILPLGQAATGNTWSLSGQLIGTNLYSARDTHVFNLTVQTAPTFKGQQLTYNNLTALNEAWQLEPSLQIYAQRSSDGTKQTRWKPGLRVTWHVTPSSVLESSLDYEVTHIDSPTRTENSNRVYYYLGGRYDF